MHPKFYCYHKDAPDVLCPVIDTLVMPIPHQSNIISGGKNQVSAGIMHLFCIVFKASAQAVCQASNVKWVQASECIIATHSAKYGTMELHTLLDAKEDDSLT